MNYQDAMLFLQNLPTKEWIEDDLEVLSEARLIHLIAQGETYIDILTALCAEDETKTLVKSNAKHHF